jgi:Lactate racemase N-terminal domain
MSERSSTSTRLAEWPSGQLLWLPITQQFERHVIPSAADALLSGLAPMASRIKEGDRVAVAVGSRGISSAVEVTRSLVGWLRSLGADPFLVPAMGSHGGGTADGQVQVLEALGFTHEAVGARIVSGMETILLGETSHGVPVLTDRNAAAADLVIPVARVKPHTDFRGPIESGPTKMLAIGLGKQRGAQTVHSVELSRFSAAIAEVGATVLQKLSVPFCIAIVEDAYDEAGIVEVIPTEVLAAREPELLVVARAWMPSLPVDELEILVVQEMGKNISGNGMDPNITGRFYVPGVDGGSTVQRLVVLDLTAQTHGNATGLGVADVVTRRLADKVDWQQTYTNEVTAHTPVGARLPLVALDDEEAFAVALHTLTSVPRSDVRLAWIRNTLTISEVMLTLPALDSLHAGADVVPGSRPMPISFDERVLSLPAAQL